MSDFCNPMLELQPVRLPHPQAFPGKNSTVVAISSSTVSSQLTWNPSLLACISCTGRRLHLTHQGSRILINIILWMKMMPATFANKGYCGILAISHNLPGPLDSEGRRAQEGEKRAFLSHLMVHPEETPGWGRTGSWSQLANGARSPDSCIFLCLEKLKKRKEKKRNKCFIFFY